MENGGRLCKEGMRFHEPFKCHWKMYVYIKIHIYIYIHIYVHILQQCVYIYICTYIYTNVYIYIYSIAIHKFIDPHSLCSLMLEDHRKIPRSVLKLEMKLQFSMPSSYLVYIEWGFPSLQ